MLISKQEKEKYEFILRPGQIKTDEIYRIIVDFAGCSRVNELAQIRDFVIRQQIYSTEDLLVFDRILFLAIKNSREIMNKCFQSRTTQQFKFDGYVSFHIIEICYQFRKAAEQNPVRLTLRGSETMCLS